MTDLDDGTEKLFGHTLADRVRSGKASRQECESYVSAMQAQKDEIERLRGRLREYDELRTQFATLPAESMKGGDGRQVVPMSEEKLATQPKERSE